MSYLLKNYSLNWENDLIAPYEAYKICTVNAYFKHGIDMQSFK